MIYLDSHRDLKLDWEAKENMLSAIKAGIKDEFNVKGLNLFYNDQGRAFCLSEAPSIDAVRKTHEAKGVKCDEIVEVRSLIS